MPHHTVDESKNEDDCDNLVSNLPLLFAGGYPTSLEKITESQLEAFIPFMVQCSLGQVHIQSNFECSEPEWWPEDLDFSIPLRKPRKRTGCITWLAKLKEIVAICYKFHKSVFLLRFCENLAAHQPETLRFINNYNSTTSLYDRASNKLLVTFRNENMLYDQVPINNKKTLMPRTHSSQSIEKANERMVEHALFDIYLCDNCEAELYSLEAYTEHEKSCQVDDDDDVIFCGAEAYEPIDDNGQLQATFLQNFQLGNPNIPASAKLSTPHKRNHHHHKDDLLTPDMKLRRISRRSRTVMILTKCPTIPISSPAGQCLLKTSKNAMSNDYIMERLDRFERFCTAPPLRSDGSNRPKFMDKRPVPTCTSSFRRTSGYCHTYRFPRRQYSLKWQERAFEVLNSILLKQTNCKPVRVELKKLTNEDIESYQLNSRLDRLKRLGQITLTKTTKTAVKTNVIDFIDLCSSDDEVQGKDNRLERTIVDFSTASTSNATSDNSNSSIPNAFGLFGDAITLKRITNNNNNTNNKNLSETENSTTIRKIQQRRITLHTSRLMSSRLSTRLQSVATTVTTRRSQADEQNQENIHRYLNGNSQAPKTRATIPNSKSKRTSDVNATRSTVAQLISIDLT